MSLSSSHLLTTSTVVYSSLPLPIRASYDLFLGLLTYTLKVLSFLSLVFMHSVLYCNQNGLSKMHLWLLISLIFRINSMTKLLMSPSMDPFTNTLLSRHTLTQTLFQVTRNIFQILKYNKFCMASQVLHTLFHSYNVLFFSLFPYLKMCHFLISASDSSRKPSKSGVCTHKEPFICHMKYPK